MRRTSKFCISENYHCNCVKCRLAIKTAHELEFSQVEKELRNQHKTGLEHNSGKLPLELMKEMV